MKNEKREKERKEEKIKVNEKILLKWEWEEREEGKKES